MHALGFRHEHQRPDRDKYVEVFTKNIVPELRFDDAILNDLKVILNDWSPYNKGKLSVAPSVQLSLKRVRHQVNNAL